MCGTYDVRPNWHTFPKKKRFRLFETWTIMSQKRKLRRGEKCHKPALCPHVIPSCVSRYNLKNNSSYIPEKTKRLFFLDVLLTVHLSIFISVFNQFDAQNLFHSKFYFMPLHVSSTCAHHQEDKNCITQPLVSSDLIGAMIPEAV